LYLARSPTSTLFPYTTLFRSSRRKFCLPCGQAEHYSYPCQPSTVRVSRTPFAPTSSSRLMVRLYATIPCNHSRETLRHVLLVCRSEEHTSELQSRVDLVCRLL